MHCAKLGDMLQQWQRCRWCAEGRSYSAVAVGDEETLGQGLGGDGVQEAFQRHALAVHPACHNTVLALGHTAGNSLQRKSGQLWPNITIVPDTPSHLP